MRITNVRRTGVSLKLYRNFLSVSLFLIALSLVFSGCVPPQNSPNTAQQPASPANAVNSAVGGPAPSPAAGTRPEHNLPITLPLLGAMLADEGFVRELKERAGLNDEQIQRLQQLSDNATQGLDESDPLAAPGSTRQSVETAMRAIRGEIGDDKANQVFQLMRERYEGGGEFLAMKPNTIPTDTRIVVNAPAYRMDIFREGQLVKTYKVAIGYPEFPLPTGLRKATSIIFNPTWTPPDEPWVRGKVQPGKKVEAGSKLNPLGPVKIPIGLPSLIHGGKQPSKLGSFGSHGCVGLTDQQILNFSKELSALAGQPISDEQIRSYRADKTKTEDIKLTNPVPVELRYETIVVENGALHIYRDVYEHGTNTAENLERVLSVYGLSLNDLSPDIRTQVEAALRDMAYDAQGNPVDQSGGANSNANTNANKNSANNSAKVTRSIKGQKEVVINIPQLAGKGYPAPVNLSQQ